MPSADPKLRLLVRHSDSSKDRALAEELLGHLKPLQRFANLDVWSDARLRAGDETRREIERAIDQADVADEIFTRLMGDVVEPRREFIQENALSVANLDV